MSAFIEIDNPAGWDALANAMRAARTAMGMTTEDACIKAGISKQRWSFSENSKGRRMRRETAARIERALKWPKGLVERIVAGEEVVDEEIESRPCCNHDAEIAVLNLRLEAVELALAQIARNS